MMPSFRGQERRELHPTEFIAHFRAKNRPELIRQLLLGTCTDIHQQRVDNAVTREGVDLEPALVGRQHLLALHVDVLHALVDPDQLIHERNPESEACAGSADRPAGLILVQDRNRLAEADDNRLLRLGHDWHACEHERQDDEAEGCRQQRVAANIVGHCCCSCC